MLPRVPTTSCAWTSENRIWSSGMNPLVYSTAVTALSPSSDLAISRADTGWSAETRVQSTTTPLLVSYRTLKPTLPMSNAPVTQIVLSLAVPSPARTAVISAPSERIVRLVMPMLTVHGRFWLGSEKSTVACRA